MRLRWPKRRIRLCPSCYARVPLERHAPGCPRNYGRWSTDTPKGVIAFCEAEGQPAAAPQKEHLFT